MFYSDTDSQSSVGDEDAIEKWRDEMSELIWQDEPPPDSSSLCNFWVPC